MLRSRRGAAYIVEAAFIYPMIIAVTVLLLAAAVYIYGLTAACSDMNRAVRRSAGTEAHTVYYSENDGMRGKNIAVTANKGLITGTAEASTYRNYRGRVYFDISRKNRFRAETVLVNESQVLWDMQAVKNAAGIFIRD